MANNGIQPSRKGSKIMVSMVIPEIAKRRLEEASKRTGMPQSAIIATLLMGDFESRLLDDVKAVRIAELRRQIAELESA